MKHYDPLTKGLEGFSEEEQQRVLQVISMKKRGAVGLEGYVKALGFHRYNAEKLAELIPQMGTGKRVITKPYRSTKGLRTRLVTHLNTKSPEELEAYCEKYSVSMVSYRNDSVGLIEAIVDEMLSLEAV